ncbi:MAG TPA: peptidylprolyl isomerase [Armatimonadota bacterium]|nr:peptidylprolyl isomerase [Armatimonadota bacterium]
MAKNNNNRVELNQAKKAGSATISKKRERRSVSATSSVASLTVMRERLRHVTRWIFYGLGAVMVLSFGLVTVPNMRGNESQSGDVAVVGRHKITREGFEANLKQMKESPYLSMMGGGGPTQELSLRNMVLEQNIDHYLKLDAAKREHNRVGRKQLQERMDQVIDQTIQQAKSNFHNDKDYKEKFLKLRMKVKDEEGLRNKLRKELRGDSAWIQATREQILIENLERTVRARAASVSLDKAKPDEIEVHARQILIKSDKRSPAEARRMAEQALAAVKSGQDFAKVARAQSEDDYSKAKGGDMDWLGQNGFWQGPELANAAFALKPGQVSDLIQARDGFHIMKLEGRRYSSTKYWEDYGEGLKKQAKIVVRDPVLLAYRQLMTDEEASQKQIAAAKNDAARKAATAQQTQKRNLAVSRLEKAVDKTYDPDTRAAAYFTVGSLYIQQNNNAKAAESFGQAAKERPAPEIYLALGDAQKKLNERNAALASYKLASDMASDTTSQQNYFTHMMLQRNFTELNDAGKAAAEKTWIENYQKSQASSGGMGGFPGGNFTVR